MIKALAHFVTYHITYCWSFYLTDGTSPVTDWWNNIVVAFAIPSIILPKFKCAPKIVGSFGEETKNDNGELLREFAAHNNLKITNIFFCRKEGIHKYVWHDEGINQ
jgi:hypothetical protein